MEKRIKNSFAYSFLTGDSQIRNLIILNSKCLFDDRDEKAVRIDEKRLRCELLYYKYYSENYKRGMYGLAPLVSILASNKNRRVGQMEAARNINMVSFGECGLKYEKTMSAIILSCAYHKILQKPGVGLDELVEAIKEEVVNAKLDCSCKMDIIDSEKARIGSIQKIDRLARKDLEGLRGDGGIDAILRVIYQIFVDDYEEVEPELLSVKGALLGVAGAPMKLDPERFGIENWEFILSMADYIIRLRENLVGKSRFEGACDPRKLVRIKKGESSMDPVLGKILVEDVFMDGEVLNMDIKSKSGKYVFKFKKSSAR